MVTGGAGGTRALISDSIDAPMLLARGIRSTKSRLVALRGLFRHLYLRHKAITFYGVSFTTKICPWASSLEKISKSYSQNLFLNSIFPKKSRKFSRTFRIHAMSGTVRQEKVEPGTSGPQKVAQAYLRYYLSAETRPEGPG